MLRARSLAASCLYSRRRIHRQSVSKKWVALYSSETKIIDTNNADVLHTLSEETTDDDVTIGDRTSTILDKSHGRGERKLKAVSRKL